MNWVSLLLQLVSFRRSFMQSQMMMQNAKAAAEKGKRAALFGAACLVAVVLVLAGFITGVIELGLQVDRGVFFHFTGLLGSGLALIFFGALIVACASLWLRTPEPPEEPPAPVENPEAELKRLGEQMLLRFLQKLTGDGPRTGAPKPGADSGATRKK